MVPKNSGNTGLEGSQPASFQLLSLFFTQLHPLPEGSDTRKALSLS